jgi:nucleoside-diphosphate-sugar epimerase
VISMQNILVTGAEGFIGRRLVEALRSAGHSVLELGRVDGDITDPSTLEPFLEIPVDFVFHLAGRTYVPDSWREPASFQHVNVIGAANVLELCRKKKVPLTCVSAYLYGVPASLPIKETDRIEPNNPYAFSKFMAESLCEFYFKHFDVPVTIIRPFNVYGIGQKTHFLIPGIIAQIKAGNPIHVKDLAPRRDYLYLDDLVDGLMCTMKNKSGHRVYNLGYGSSLSVKEIIDIIQSLAETSLDIVCENVPRKNEIQDVCSDIRKAQEGLAWQTRHSFEDGIRKILAKEKVGNE